MADETRFEAEERPLEMVDQELDGIVGGGQGGKPGRCLGCGGYKFTNISGGKIRCTACGWEGYPAQIGL